MLISNHNTMILFTVILSVLAACSAGSPQHFIDMDKADSLAQDWLDQTPHTNIAWIGALKTKDETAGHLPKDICYTIWNGDTDSMPDETLTTQAQRCNYLAERLAQTLGAFGFPVNDPIIIKSEYLRDIGLNYDGHEIDCIIGTYDESKMPEWDTYAPTRDLIDGLWENRFYSCEGSSPYKLDKLFIEYQAYYEKAVKRKSARFLDPGISKNLKKQGFKISDFPLWKHGKTN